MRTSTPQTCVLILLVLVATSIGALTGGVWTFTGSLNQARFNHQAVMLNSGKVLVLGGQY